MLYYAQAEIEGVLQFIDEVYRGKFNFSYDLALSTRPEKFIGDEFF
jgi:threonyl-tRNA synthetase